MKILHITLTQQGKDHASLRYFWENAFNYKEHKLSLAEIKGLSDTAKTDYYTRIPVDYTTTGQALYKWLDKGDCLLTNALDQPRKEDLVIAVATDKGLAHLPWELLHDGNCFLVEKRPSIIPVRWVSNGQPIAISVNAPQNRPLNVLFMATSPLGVEPELDYEAEEGRILKATQRTTFNLQVEESGYLNEIRHVVGEYEQSYFDVFHLTGHATHKDGKPCFLTEDEYGNRVDSSTDAIANALTYPLPHLIFLSGCRTAYDYSSDNAVVPSMAEELLNMGATTVLGWGERVRDPDATSAASQLYRELSQGRTLMAAIACTYKALIDQKVPDWHKLRLYVADTFPQALVTRLRTAGRAQVPKPSMTVEFRDDEKRLRVVTREDFVGRRRQLQNCLRTLKTEFDKVGVLIHGMGGWGKSSIASRLWDRLPEHEKILWWRQIDESYLIKKLRDKLINPVQLELLPHLENSKVELKSRLIYLFRQLAELREKPFLFILDDFEWNLEPRKGRYILKPQAAPILSALVEAIQESGTNNRIIITCRYEFDSDLLDFLYKQGLEPFKKAELTKKLSRLTNFSSGNISDNLRQRALNLADGNPRLLEFINDELGNLDVETRLTRLEQSPELWKAQIIWDELYQLIDEPLQRIISYCLVYEIPVPMVALEAVCDQLPNYQQQLQRELKLGLIEVSPEVQEENRLYRVSRILPHIIPTIRLPEAPGVYSIYQKAHEKLHQLWRNKGKKENWQEIFRLKFANKSNPERFRQGFSQMLAVKLNSAPNSALEAELRKVAGDLVKDGLCTQLENYLKQEQWKEADKETAWIFYQVMVQENYKDWNELFQNFPCETIQEINQLWLQNSNNQFGISIQMEVYQRSGGTTKDNPAADVWEKFLMGVGWKQEDYLTYDQIIEIVQKREMPPDEIQEVQDVRPPILPVIIYTHPLGGELYFPIRGLVGVLLWGSIGDW